MAIPIIAALAAPLIGGAMSLVGGGLSITGGVINAGATVAGIASRAAGGIMGAVGGLAGGGQSGLVKSKTSPTGYRNEKGQFAKAPAKKEKSPKGKQGKQSSTFSTGGMGLAKVKSSITPGLTGGAGRFSDLPTGHESETTLLSQILTQIRTNTGILSAMLGVLSQPPPPPPTPPQDLIDAPKSVRDDGEGPGRVKRIFSSLSTGLKDLSGSLGSTGKFLLKGLLGGAALLGFIKYRDNITGFIARTFEMLEGFGSKFADDEDPLGKFFDALTGTGEGSIISSLKNGLAFVIEELVYALKLMINELGIPGFSFKNLAKPGINTTSAPADVSAIAATSGQDMSALSVSSAMADSKYSDFKGTEESQADLQKIVTGRINQMYNLFEKSGGRVQWTNIGRVGFKLGVDPSSSLIGSGATVAGIMSTVPIIDGKESTMAKLKELNIQDSSFGLDRGNTKQSELNMNAVIKNLRQNSDYMQNIMAGNPIFDPGGFLTKDIPYADKIKANELKNKNLMSPLGASLNDGSKPIVVATGNADQYMIDNGDKIAMATSVDSRERTFLAVQEMMA